jgi:hypothetical protein
MRGTMPGTATRFWAGLLVYAFTLVFGFLIDRPNRYLSSSENFIDIAWLDDPDDPDGLFATLCSQGSPIAGVQELRSSPKR